MARKNHHEQQSTFSKKEKLITALAAPFAVVALAACNSGDRVEIRVDRPGVSQDANPDTSNVSHESRSDLTLENSTPEEFYNDANFTDEERVRWAHDQLQQPHPEFPDKSVERVAYERMLADLTAEGREVSLNVDYLPTPSRSNTAGEANTLTHVVTATALYSDNSALAEKLLAAGFDNNSSIIGRIRNGVVDFVNQGPDVKNNIAFDIAYIPADGSTRQSTGATVDMATKPTSNQTIGGRVVPENGVLTRVAYQKDDQDQSLVSEEIQAFVGGRWISKDVYSDSDSRWIPPRDLVNLP